jgi:molecular chaperone GrpE
MQSSRASDAPQGAPDDRQGEDQRRHATEQGEPAQPLQGGEPPGGEPQQERRQVAPERELRAELAALEERYKRALADLENYRKRSAREIERRVAECREAVIRDWLEAVDSVERALRMDPDGPAAEGLRAVLEQMEAILRREGVHRIGAEGEHFDPQRFEAVGVRASSQVPDRTVIEVVRSGFGSDGHVLRPAQVIVADAQRHNGS